MITVCSRGISNGLSKLYNDGFDFGPDTMLNATLPNQYGPPYTKTSGLLEAVNYQQANGGKIQMTAGRFVISPDAPLKQVTTSNVIGVPEYAVIPIYGGYNPVKAFNTSRIAGDTSSDTDVQTDYLNNTVDRRPDSNTTTVIDVSGLTNLPSGASVVLFGYYTLNQNLASSPEFINMHDFMIYTATPSTAGQNICGGYDFYLSCNCNVTNITVYSTNNPGTTVFPANTVIGQVIDAGGAATGWVDNLASRAMYYGFILGYHVHAGKLFNQACYYGLVAYGDHGLEVDYYDTQGCIYAVYESPPFPWVCLYIHHWDGEYYASPTENYNQTTDVYVGNV